MRELERAAADSAPALPRRIALVGRGRLGSALAAGLEDGGVEVVVLGRGERPGFAVDAVLLCVPDAAIPAAAAAVAGAAPLIGHTSGATPLHALGAREAFGLHPLQTFTRAGGSFAGAGCAVGGTTPAALACAEALARRLGMRPFELSDADRPAYHAAASIASNFLVTLEAAAERRPVLDGAPHERSQPVAVEARGGARARAGADRPGRAR
jgi:predicted short-subunit dehydrogenase-like oxidoreductase (DUF2520 family)